MLKQLHTTDIPSDAQQIARTLWCQRAHYHVHNNPPLVSYLSHTNPVLTLTLYPYPVPTLTLYPYVNGKS
jgi:hypothetical protein